MQIVFCFVFFLLISIITLNPCWNWPSGSGQDDYNENVKRFWQRRRRQRRGEKIDQKGWLESSAKMRIKWRKIYSANIALIYCFNCYALFVHNKATCERHISQLFLIIVIYTYICIIQNPSQQKKTTTISERNPITLSV